jgi:hypothetical protein
MQIRSPLRALQIPSSSSVKPPTPLGSRREVTSADSEADGRSEVDLATRFDLDYAGCGQHGPKLALSNPNRPQPS